MNDKTEYRLTNIKKRQIKLAAQQVKILKQDGQTALSSLLDAPAPATLIQSFPEQDLYYLMNKVGADDFIPVLSMASSDQWEYILDVDTWDGDRIDIDTMTQTFDLLFQADPQRLLRWAVTQKTSFFEYYLSKNLSVTIREHDDPPPSDFDDYITIDDKFYFRFPLKPKLKKYDNELPQAQDHQPAWELIEKMIKSLAEMDLSVYHGLLQETMGLLPAEAEEEQFRLKTNRLAEKGFLPAHEAIGIYQPVDDESLRKRPKKLESDKSRIDPDIPLPPQFFTGFLDDEDYFVKTLREFDPETSLELESELAALINKVISADKIKLKTRTDIEHAILKTCNYLNLGLEILTRGNYSLSVAQNVIEDRFLEDIFRTGSREGIRIKTKAMDWFRHSFMNSRNLPLSFLDEYFLGVIGGLMIERPMFFDPQAGPDLYRDFKSLKDVNKTIHSLDQIIAIDSLLKQFDIDIQTFNQGILTYKTMILTLWAKNRLNLPENLEPILTQEFRPFFKELFNSQTQTAKDPNPLDDLFFFIQEKTGVQKEELSEAGQQAITDLMLEIEQEYGIVDPVDIDPRFIPHFLLK